MKFIKSYTDGPFGQIHFVSGSKGIPLILLHQSPTSSVQFSSVMGLLEARGFRPIAIDTPGFGMSDAPNFVPAIEDYAKAVIALLDNLKIENCYVVGHHTGAQIATEVAILDSRVDGLILNTPFILEPAENAQMRDQIVPTEKAFVPRPDGGHLLDVWNLRCSVAQGFSAEFMHKHVAENLQRLELGWYGHSACFNYDHGERIKLVQQPTLVLTNSGDFLIEYAKRAIAIRPDFDYVELNGGTLDIIDEQPENWADAVSNFALESKTRA